ncbi:reelin domain-containing protein 1 isoform X1 [Anas platyrhynchos]|uniref:reelin domain-containing protein 1 isoform X1 n=2 Tax=Anas platyrhynchos TaxID=8839 RepID=UPI00065E8D13|nr:reelin domain-containing protein 1 isoform X1 [Anas platyrhynchos]
MEDGRKAHLVIAGWLCTTLCLVSYTAAFSHGASLSACADMMPKHLRAQLHSPRNNYVTIHTNVSFYFPGGKVPVTVRSSRDFMGFLLQARKVSNDEVAGTFVFIPPGSKLLTCFEDGDTVTHSDKSLKRNLSFVWKAPDQPIGDIKFFISVVQSYFVYWARIESAVVAQQGLNTTSAGTKKAGPLTSASLQERADPRVAGTASKAASEISNGHEELPEERAQVGIQGSSSPAAAPSSPQHSSPAPASPASLTPTPAEGPGFGAHPDTSPAAEPTQSQPLLDAPSRSRGSSNSSSLGLEPSLTFQEPGMASALQSFLFQDYTSSQSPSDGAQSTASTTRPYPCLTCKEDGQASTENGATLKTSLQATASWSALQMRHHLGEAAVMTAWLGEADTTSNLSLASRQMAESKPPLPLEEAGSVGEEEEVREETGGNTLPWVTRPAPESAVPGKGEGSRRGTRLIAAQLGILLVCTAVLGLALAAGLRCLYAQYCHKRTEVSFSEPGSDVVTVRENGEMLHFRKIRENSFVLVQAEYNWVSPSSSGKRRII